MDVKKSLCYKAIAPLVTRDEMMILSCHNGTVKPLRPRINEKMVHDMEEFDPNGDIRKLHKGIPWTDEETEQKSWREVEYYVKKVGVRRFVEHKSRPYEKTANLNLCQRRRKFRKRSKEDIDEQYESNYRIKGENNEQKR